MKKVTILLFILATVGMSAHARTLAEIFCDKGGAIDKAFPYLDYNARMDMVDYIRAGSDAPTREVMYNSEVRITSLSDSVLRIRGVELDVDVTMITAKQDTVITVVRTLSLGGGDSDVAVYDTKWHPLNKAFTAPEYSEWLVKDATKTVDIEVIAAAVPYVTYTAVVDPAIGTLTLTNTVATTPGLDKTVAALFRPKIVYRTDGKKFKKQKP